MACRLILIGWDRGDEAGNGDRVRRLTGVGTRVTGCWVPPP